MKTLNKIVDSKSFAGPFETMLGIGAGILVWRIGDAIYKGIAHVATSKSGDAKKPAKGKTTKSKKK